MVLYKYWNYVKKFIEGKALLWLLLLFIFCMITKSIPSYQPIKPTGFIANLLLSVLTISMAFTIPKLNQLLKGNDISYGLYIYHMPILNVFVTFNLKGDIRYLWMVLAITMLFALLSWTLIEKRMLQLKEYKKYKILKLWIEA